MSWVRSSSVTERNSPVLPREWSPARLRGSASRRNGGWPPRRCPVRPRGRESPLPCSCRETRPLLSPPDAVANRGQLRSSRNSRPTASRPAPAEDAGPVARPVAARSVCQERRYLALDCGDGRPVRARHEAEHGPCVDPPALDPSGMDVPCCRTSVPATSREGRGLGSCFRDACRARWTGRGSLRTLVLVFTSNTRAELASCHPPWPPVGESASRVAQGAAPRFRRGGCSRGE